MKHFFALLLGLLPLVGAAQRNALPPPDAPVQLARTELLLDPATDEVQVQAVPADTAVVLLIRHELPGTRKVRYVFQQYGPDLRLRRETDLQIPTEFQVERLCAEPGVVYALFRAPETVGKLLVAAYDVRGGQVRTQPFETKLCRQVVALKALDGRLLATVALTDQQHQTVLLLDVAGGQFQFLSSLYEPLDSELTSVADRPTGRAEFVLSQSNGRKQRLLLRLLSAEHGQLLHSELVQAESERSLLTAQLSPPQDTSARLLAGTYGLRDLHYVQGLFATDLTAVPASEASPHSALRFYDFRHLRHFFDYLKPAHSARLHDRSARREARAAQPLKWHYHLLLHELLPQPDGGYTLVAEVYSPQYHYSNYGGISSMGANFPRYGPVGPLGGYGSNASNYGRTFLGFRTSHVLVCGFDKRGNLLWDNSFVVGPGVMRSELEPAVQALPLADGHLVLAYISDSEVHYKRINQGEPSPNDAWVDLLTSASPTPEKVLDASLTDVAPWADNQYVASGFQHIRAGKNGERQVFFLQLLKF